ncbi:hypothetical protein EB796_018825 [Bugula neritina]|uniref:Uncharacterized protein n=1 Tax=Bugula neritina TaxID=10212 RepID=A0A7J7JB59_BUGNE|nr:hypothetical protein EB796_018825 [Bugula neritina]
MDFSGIEIAISLNVEINSFRPKCNIGSARYHGEDNLTILVNELLKDYSESEDTLNLQKPLKFCWSQVKNAGTSACRDFPCSRVKHSACVSGQQIYVLGGRDGRYPVNDLWTYDLYS